MRADLLVRLTYSGQEYELGLGARQRQRRETRERKTEQRQGAVGGRRLGHQLAASIDLFHDCSLKLRPEQHEAPERRAWGTSPPTAPLISAAAWVVSDPLLPPLSIHPPKSCQSTSVCFLTTCAEHPLCARTEGLHPEPPGTLRSTGLMCRAMPTTVVRALPSGSPPPSLVGPLLDQRRRPAHLSLQAFLFSPGLACRNPSKLGHLFFLCSPSSLSFANLSSELLPSASVFPEHSRWVS